MTESPEELAAVEQLLAESDALRGWLARLDQAPGGVPDAVRQRVRDDYQHRLDDVTAGLRAHGDVIGSKLRDDRSEHADLQARAGASRDALAEAELRHAVGEYDQERFDGEHRRHSSDIETYQLSISAVAERIARLEQIHALVERAPRPLPIELEFEPIVDEPPVPPPVERSEPAPIPVADLAPDADQALAVFDEPLADRGAEESSVAPIAETGPLSFRPTPGGSDFSRPLVAPPPRVQSFENAPPLGIPAADQPPRFLRPGEVFGRQPAPPAVVPHSPPSASARSEPAPSAAAAESSGSPLGRTLRCGECGAMNRPLEWYCEKCGAELTAV